MCRKYLTDIGSLDILELLRDNTDMAEEVMVMKDGERIFRQALAEAKQQRAKWDKRIEVLQDILGDIGNGTSPASDVAETVVLNECSSTEAAVTVLRTAGKPLHLKQIIARMERGGYPVRDREQLYGTLYTNMKRKPGVFQKVKPASFGLVEWSRGQE